MPVPFAAETWHKISDVPLPIISVTPGVRMASYHAPSRTVQVVNINGESGVKFFNTSMISFNDGSTWVDTYRGDLVSESEREEIFGVWSLETASGLYHYQIRANVQHAFLLADGTLNAGGISLYATGPDSPGFSFVQQLYSWPHVNADPPTTGGNAVYTWFPSATPAVQIAGSGPAGEDAFWMVVSLGLDFGGTGNPQTLEFQDLWRSLDGFGWEKVDDLTPINIRNYGRIVESTTGRVVITSPSVSSWYTDDGPDLVGATWTQTVGGGTNEHFIPMFGGTFVSSKNGGFASTGFASISCDDAANFFAAPGSPVVPLNGASLVLKLGPTEMILIANSFAAPSTETVAFYSSDGGETYVDGGAWLSSAVGEFAIAGFLRTDGTPLVVTRRSVFFSSDKAQGVAGVRTSCPLANAGLATARKLVLCGGVITPDCQE